MSNKLTHVDEYGKLLMVDVSQKDISHRLAVVRGVIAVSDKAFKLISENKLQKGDVFTTAKIAGITSAKYTAMIIPLCHNIFLDKINLEIALNEADKEVIVSSTTLSTTKTGVEMEAMMATSGALVAIYDMIKGIDRTAVIKSIKLIEKSGGNSGTFKRKDNEN